MSNLFLVVKKENKDKVVRLISEKSKILENIGLRFNYFKIYQQDKDIITVAYNIDFDLNVDIIEKLVLIIKELIQTGMIIKVNSLVDIRDEGYVDYYEVFYFDPRVELNNIKIEELRPDYKEKIGEGYLLLFKSKLKDKPDKIRPDSYLSLHTTIEVNYIGTNKKKETGLMIYSKKEDKKQCDRLVIGKAFRDLESGVIVNDEQDILVGLNKANELLKKRGMQILDIRENYDKILSQL